jgi:hypothetical protein
MMSKSKGEGVGRGGKGREVLMGGTVIMVAWVGILMYDLIMMIWDDVM